MISIEPEWISAIVATTALGLAIFEYYFQRRPYLKIDIRVEENDGSYFFYGEVKNIGASPAYFSIKKEDASIKIGDENYLSAADMQACAFPQDSQPPNFEIGHVNQVGIENLLGGKYKDNTAEISIKMSYSSRNTNRFFQKFFNFAFRFKYGINFSIDKVGKLKIVVFVLEQDFF